VGPLAGLALLLLSSCSPTVPEKKTYTPAAASERLTGWLLVASPTMPDPRFAKTVIFVVRHNGNGAMGLVVNRPIAMSPPAKLRKRAVPGVAGPVIGRQIRVHYGGPVQPTRGFVLHSSDYAQDGTVPITKTVSMTANREILKAITTGDGPRRGFIAMGYAGWSAGQLESEIRRRDWVVVSSDAGLVFDRDARSKWRRAMDRRGVDL